MVIKIYFLILFSVCIFNLSYADEIIFKTGGKIKGIIIEENGKSVEVRIKSGKIKLKKDEIVSLERNPQENEKLEEEWRAAQQEELDKIVKSQPKEEIHPRPAAESQPKKESQKAASKYKTSEIFDIKCEDKLHSYVVCLPKTYDGAKRTPVLFCFDPGGDGRNAVRQFMFAADKYEWIVIGSNDISNSQTWDIIFKAQDAMLGDIKKRFTVNDRRFYAAGFSAGGKMGYNIASRYPMNFRGVISCGAGCVFENIPKEAAVFYCVGKYDEAALIEIKKAYLELKNRFVSTKIKEFDGGHQWPPREVLEEAVDWFARQ